MMPNVKVVVCDVCGRSTMGRFSDRDPVRHPGQCTRIHRRRSRIIAGLVKVARSAEYSVSATEKIAALPDEQFKRVLRLAKR